MVKIGYLKEIGKVKTLPKELIEAVKGILTILDNEYGEKRDIDNDGGYVLLVDDEGDFESIKSDLYIDLEEDAIPEFVDIIRCENGEVLYTNSLILCNNDYGISIIMLLSITPKNLKDYIIEN
jgi:hypothetical protein